MRNCKNEDLSCENVLVLQKELRYRVIARNIGNVVGNINPKFHVIITNTYDFFMPPN